MVKSKPSANGLFMLLGKAIRGSSAILLAVVATLLLCACTPAHNAEQARDTAKNREVAAMQAKAKALIDTGRYKEAHSLLDQILAVDPTNEFAIGEYPLTEPRGGFRLQGTVNDDEADDDRPHGPNTAVPH
jgi:hypothetical protein